MAQPIKPNVTVEGDNENRIMARGGDLVGFSKSRCVWRFGFLRTSDAAKAYGVSSPCFVWVISEYNGNILEMCLGFGMELPKRFTDIISSKF